MPSTSVIAHHLASCHTAVCDAARRLRRPSIGPALDETLHRSLVRTLNEHRHRLLHHDPNLRVVPTELHERVGNWKASISDGALDTLLTRKATDWRDGLIDLLQRLDQDWDSIASTLDIDRHAAVTLISHPLGDSHNGGRCVYKATLNTGAAVIYKPRSVALEHAFGTTIQWLNDGGCEPVLDYCRTLVRSHYGWARCVDDALCATAAEAETFYRRQGGFLALFLLLCGSDGISENFVVHGADPIWIDTECLCVPQLAALERKYPLPDWMRESVLSTSLLYSGNEHHLPPRRSSALNRCPLADRRAVYDGDVMKDQYLNAVMSGFRAVYSWILARRDVFTHEHGPLSWWNGLPTRIVLRATIQYEELTHALLLAPVRERAFAVSSVADVLRMQRGAEPWLPTVVNAEMVALWRGDVPYCWAPTNSRDIYVAASCVGRHLANMSGLEYVRWRIARMGQKDLTTQMWLIDSFSRLPATCKRS